MKQLPLLARLFVASVIVIGAALLVFLLPTVEFAQPYLFLALISLATLSSALKVNLPFDNSVSSMSASSALGFASLILLGPHETMLVARPAPTASAA